MKRYFSLIVVLSGLMPGWCKAQTVDFSGKDSISVSEFFILQTDTMVIDSLFIESLLVNPEKFKPDSKKATIYALIFPGLGQIYNRKYWKLPLVYGSFLGCAYAINWNGNQYSGYRKAYIDFIDEDSNSNSWEDYRYGVYRRTPYEEWTTEMKRNFETALKSAREYHRRNRDLSYIVTVGIYGLWIIDAYVDAQLFDFDISPDLSMRIEPVLLNKSFANNNRTIGMQFSFTF